MLYKTGSVKGSKDVSDNWEMTGRREEATTRARFSSIGVSELLEKLVVVSVLVSAHALPIIRSVWILTE